MEYFGRPKNSLMEADLLILARFPGFPRGI
jgi:hypothetical protein